MREIQSSGRTAPPVPPHTAHSSTDAHEAPPSKAIAKLLLDDEPLLVMPTLAKHLDAFSDAIILQQLHWCLLHGGQLRGENDETVWVHATLREWRTKHFPFWDETTIKRAFTRLERRGAVCVEPMTKDEREERNYRGQDNRTWWGIHYPSLQTLLQTLPSPPPPKRRGERKGPEPHPAPAGSPYLPKLLPENPLIILKALAQRIGLNEAIALQQLHYALGREQAAGRKIVQSDDIWLGFTHQEWLTQFSFWSISTWRRTYESLCRQKLIRTGQLLERDGDQRQWLTINYTTLDALAEEEQQELQVEAANDATGHAQNADSFDVGAAQNAALPAGHVQNAATPVQNADSLPAGHVQNAATPVQNADSLPAGHVQNAAKGHLQIEQGRLQNEQLIKVMRDHEKDSLNPPPCTALCETTLQAAQEEEEKIPDSHDPPFPRTAAPASTHPAPSNNAQPTRSTATIPRTSRDVTTPSRSAKAGVHTRIDAQLQALGIESANTRAEIVVLVEQQAINESLLAEWQAARDHPGFACLAHSPGGYIANALLNKKRPPTADELQARHRAAGGGRGRSGHSPARALPGRTAIPKGWFDDV